VTRNSLYQTVNYAASTAQVNRYAILISSTASAASDSFTVTKNYIGGREPNTGGAAFTIPGTATGSSGNHAFMGIHINTHATATQNVVSENVIRNIILNRSSTTAHSFGALV